MHSVTMYIVRFYSVRIRSKSYYTYATNIFFTKLNAPSRFSASYSTFSRNGSISHRVKITCCVFAKKTRASVEIYEHAIAMLYNDIVSSMIITIISTEGTFEAHVISYKAYFHIRWSSDCLREDLGNSSKWYLKKLVIFVKFIDTLCYQFMYLLDLEWKFRSFASNIHDKRTIHLIGATMPSYFSNYENKKC